MTNPRSLAYGDLGNTFPSFDSTTNFERLPIIYIRCIRCRMPSLQQRSN